MNIKRLIAAAGMAMLLFPLAAAASAGAAQNVTLAKGETVEGDFFRAGSTVYVDGTVTGDVMAAGGQVDVSGPVGADLLVIGGSLSVSGAVTGSARMAGGTIALSGDIGRNVTLGGGTLRIDPAAHIRGNAYLAGGTVSVRGVVDGALQAAGSNIVISGSVRGNTVLAGDSITISRGATMGGGVTYYSNNKIVIEDGANVSGPVEQRAPGEYRPSAAKVAGGALFFLIWKYLAYLVLLLVAWRLMRPSIAKMRAETSSDFWPKLGWGIVGMIVIPIGSIIAAITIVGLPLGIIALVLFAVLAFLASVAGILLFGTWLSGYLRISDQPERFPAIAFTVGAVVLWVISLVPGIGFAVSFVVWAWSFGTMLRSMAGRFRA